MLSLIGKKKKLLLKELAEFRTQRARKRIGIQDETKLLGIKRGKDTTSKNFDNDIRRFKQQKFTLLSKHKPTVIKQDINTPADQITNQRESRSRSNSVPYQFIARCQRKSLPHSNSAIKSTRQESKPRSLTVSFPITSYNTPADMRNLEDMRSLHIKKPLSIDISSTRLTSASKTGPIKPFPGLVAHDNEVLITQTDACIPKSVIERGRRMSRSASCMNDLVRQELSDYIDSKSEHLPTLALSPSSTTQLPGQNTTCRSFTMDNTNKGRQSQTPLSSKSTATSPSHNESTASPRLRQPEVLIIDDEASSFCDDESLSPRSSHPSPPLNPKPPASPRCARHLRRSKLNVKHIPMTNH